MFDYFICVVYRFIDFGQQFYDNEEIFVCSEKKDKRCKNGMFNCEMNCAIMANDPYYHVTGECIEKNYWTQRHDTVKFAYNVYWREMGIPCVDEPRVIQTGNEKADVLLMTKTTPYIWTDFVFRNVGRLMTKTFKEAMIDSYTRKCRFKKCEDIRKKGELFAPMVFSSFGVKLEDSKKAPSKIYNSSSNIPTDHMLSMSEVEDLVHIENENNGRYGSLDSKSLLRKRRDKAVMNAIIILIARSWIGFRDGVYKKSAAVRELPLKDYHLSK